MRQKSRQRELRFDSRGEAPRCESSGEASTAANGNGCSGTDHLMEEVVGRDNLKAALKRVRKNKGSPGCDGMTVDELPAWLEENREVLRTQLLAGTYRPKPVRRQSIPKSDGGTRELGIPCVLDRLVQQAILHVLQPRFDPTFSEHSYGFRPGRSAHDAVLAAQHFIQGGRGWVVDADLEKFFDRVNHDVLMGLLAKRIADKRLLRLIRAYLEAGVLANGITKERHEGTPQGGPLSPLLGNVLLDQVDRELEKRGHAFVRYADDCNVYVRSQRAGERVMEGLRRLYGQLHLRLNESKSAVAKPRDRKILGYTIWVAPGRIVKRRVAPKALAAMKERVRILTTRNGGRDMTRVIRETGDFLRGWKQYYRLADTPKVFRTLDEWIRRRLRMVQLKQWKRGRTVFRELRARGISVRDAAGVAAHTRRWWFAANLPALKAAFHPRYYDRRQLTRLGT
jgi:RNA-directed DNA polymerase